MRALSLAIIAVILAALEGRAEVQNKEQCLDFPNSHLVAARNGEFPPSAFASKPSAGASIFLYVNRTLEPGKCYRRLSLEEKVAQQAGRSEKELVGYQLRGYRHSKLNRWIETTPLSGVLSKSALNALLVPVGHNYPPMAVGQAQYISWRSWNLHLQLFPNKTYDDESDAFKHYFASFLFTKLSGPGYASFVMGLHEWDDLTMASLMDRYNNRVAIADAARILKNNPAITEREIIERAIEMIQNRGLVILRSEQNKNYDYRQAHPRFVAFAHGLLRFRLQ
jgi:hypothetical protein